MDKNKKKGFTLVELIVVLAILAILAAMLVPALTGYIDKANEKKVIATARQYYVAAQTVASEAYAEGEEITSMTNRTGTYVLSVKSGENHLGIQISVDITDQNNKWIKEFVQLSEIKDGYVVAINFENAEVYSFSLITPEGKNVMLVNGEWNVYDAPSFGI